MFDAEFQSSYHLGVLPRKTNPEQRGRMGSDAIQGYIAGEGMGLARPANMQMQRRKMRQRGEAHNGGWRFKTRPETFTWLVTLVPHNDGSMHRASKSSLVMFKSERSAANLFLASTSSSSISFCRLPTQFQRLQNLKVLPLKGYSP